MNSSYSLETDETKDYPYMITMYNEAGQKTETKAFKDYEYMIQTLTKLRLPTKEII
jgi:hypothetical protein